MTNAQKLPLALHGSKGRNGLGGAVYGSFAAVWNQTYSRRLDWRQTGSVRPGAVIATQPESGHPTRQHGLCVADKEIILYTGPPSANRCPCPFFADFYVPVKSDESPECEVCVA
jgi:hypothetical protein